MHMFKRTMLFAAMVWSGSVLGNMMGSDAGGGEMSGAMSPSAQPMVKSAWTNGAKAYSPDSMHASKKVSEISPALWERVLAEAEKLEAVISEARKEEEVELHEQCSDAVFLRRAYLDIVGRIPYRHEAKTFLDDRAPDKRKMLVKRLLESEGYVTQMFDFLTHVVKYKRTMEWNYFDEYGKWLKLQIRQNTPYHRLAYELLTARGRPRKNGAVGFWLYSNEDKLGAVARVSKAFLGINLECAQCHDHKSDKWTQKQFYQFAAYFAGMDFKEAEDRVWQKFYRLDRYHDDIEPALRRKFDFNRNRLYYYADYEFSESPHLKLHYPDDYKYENAVPGTKVEAKPLWGEAKQIRRVMMRSEVIANWITSDENRFFAKSMANRLWKHVFGLGLAEPVDDWKDDMDVLYPEVLDHLTRLFVEFDYDLKALLAVLYATKTYELSAQGEEISPRTYMAQGAMLKNITPRQLGDSLATLTVPDVDHMDGAEYLLSRNMTRRAFAKVFDRHDVSDAQGYVNMWTDFYNTISATVTKRYGERWFDNDKKVTLNAMATLFREMDGAGSDDTREQIRELIPVHYPEQESIEEEHAKFHGEPCRYDASGVELSWGSPQPTVRESLLMMNGAEVARILKNSVLKKDFFAASSPAAQADVLYLSILARYPSSDEYAQVATVLGNGEAQQNYEDLVVALLSSREFNCVQ